MPFPDVMEYQRKENPNEKREIKLGDAATTL